MAMREIKNTVEESVAITPTEEKRETLHLQKIQPTEIDKNIKTTKIKLRSNTYISLWALSLFRNVLLKQHQKYH